MCTCSPRFPAVCGRFFDLFGDASNEDSDVIVAQVQRGLIGHGRSYAPSCQPCALACIGVIKDTVLWLLGWSLVGDDGAIYDVHG